jgi:octaprenyl-diphosphate synthase
MIESSPRDAIRDIVAQFMREELLRDNAHIAGVVADMLDAGGKRLRPRITMLAGQARVPGTREDPVLAAYMELIHVATLIHDDVVDGADMRRGRGSANYLHGNRFSVLAGDYLFAWVFKKITQGYAAPIPTILSAMLAEICNGEVLQLRAAGDDTLTKERYLEIIGKKTAELFASCAEVGAIRALHEAGAEPSQRIRDDAGVAGLREFGRQFGMAFQIRDDLLDVTSDEEALGKPAGSDLREHRITLPLIFELEDDGVELRTSLKRFFAGPSGDPRSIVERVRTGPGISRTGAAIASYAAGAEAALRAVPESPARDQLTRLARNLTSFSS